jgi:hypothetical protein
MARKAITQGQQTQQQPGLRDAPQVAPQSTQQQRPRTNAQTNAIYRPGPSAANGPTSPAQSPSQVSGSSPGWMPVYAGARPARVGGGSISGAPTGVTMENVGEKLTEWKDRGYTGSTELPADPNDLPLGDDATQTTGDYVEQPAEKSNEEMINDLVRQYLEQAGNVDTTEQEALIEQRIKEQLNMDLMNQRAAAGASGFESSGALIGMDADIRRQAGTDAVEQILGARRDAEQDAFDRATGAAGMNLAERKQAYEEWKAQEQLDALNRWLDSEGGGGGGDGTQQFSIEQDHDQDGVLNAVDPDYTNPDDPLNDLNPLTGGSTGPEAEANTDTIVTNATEVASPPAGATLAGSRPPWTIYRDAEGNYYKVRQ